MRKRLQSIKVGVAASLVVRAIGYFVLGGTKDDAVEADSGVTTNSSAAASGACLVPTDPMWSRDRCE
jgi:hypothetical protein